MPIANKKIIKIVDIIPDTILYLLLIFKSPLGGDSVKLYKRIIAIFCSFAIASSFLVVPAYGAEYTSQPRSWWDSYIMKSFANGEAVGGFWSGMSSLVSDFSSSSVCVVSEDHLHHSSDSASSGVDKDGTPYLNCTCRYCGDKFKAYGSDLSTAYDTYVTSIHGNLGTTTVGSDGSFYIPMAVRDVEVNFAYKGSIGSEKVFCEHSDKVSDDISNYPCSPSVFFDCVKNYVRFSSSGSSNYGGFVRVYYAFEIACPVDGFYSCVLPPVFSYGYSDLAGEFISYTRTMNASSAVRKFSGDSLSFVFQLATGGSYLTPLFVSELLSPAYVRIVPDDTLLTSPYTSQTRLGSLPGLSYGYQNDTGEIIIYTDKGAGLFDEATGSLYNPVTGETLQADTWYYDYANRRYDIVLPNNQGNAFLEYADDKVIMSVPGEDGITNIYNYYYMADDTGETHTHDYVLQDEIPATCTTSGYRHYTCSVCGDLKTETIPATGHDWRVKSTVRTEYDSDGNLVQQGYTVYECSVCGAEYKSTDGTAPPGGDGENSDSGFRAWWRKAWDAFTSKLFGALDSAGFDVDGGTNPDGTSKSLWQRIKDAFNDTLGALIEALFDLIKEVLKMLLSLVTDMLSFFFGFLTDSVLGAVKAFFGAFKDTTLFDFFQQPPVTNPDGTQTDGGYGLPGEVETGFAFISGVIMVLPSDIRSILFFGIGIMVLLGVFKLVKA